MSEQSVVMALAAVADDVRAVRKGEQNKHGGYNFRGIDAVMNAVGPALRKHGVVVMPNTLDLQQTVVQTTSGKPQTSSKVFVRYRFFGPAGDHIDAEVWGESWDSSDKGLSQAYSVAYRTCLLQALTIPTDDPDPDSKQPQRAAEPLATPEQKGDIKGALNFLDDQAKAALKAWWKDNGLPAVDSGQLTERQAAVILDRLSASAPSAGGGDQSPEAAGDTGRENTEVSQSEPDAVDGQESGGSTHPAGPPSAAAREALGRAAKR